MGSTIYQSGGANNKLGTGLIVFGKMRDRVMDRILSMNINNETM